jgi:hypothetical protein
MAVKRRLVQQQAALDNENDCRVAQHTMEPTVGGSTPSPFTHTTDLLPALPSDSVPQSALYSEKLKSDSAQASASCPDLFPLDQPTTDNEEVETEVNVHHLLFLFRC